MESKEEFHYENIKYLSFGSPLLDCIADVPKDFLKKNNIELNTTVHKKLKELSVYNDFIALHNVTYFPGGCQFNAMRIFNWMLGKHEGSYVGFLGSVGDDEFGLKYENLLYQEGIIPIFDFIKDNYTGMCLVLCNNRDRAHITDLGASTIISKPFVESVFSRIKNLKLIYTELFILKTQENLVTKLAEIGSEDDKLFGFNLPSSFILEKFSKKIKELIGYADVVFANRAEATFFANILDLDNGESSLSEIISKLAKLPKKNKKKKRIFVITDGPNPAYCCEYNAEIKKVTFLNYFNVKNIDESKIIDTNGAGDAFAGGFLSQYIKKKPLSDCMYAGHWAAGYIIQKRGFQVPTDCNFNPDLLKNS